MRKPPITTDGSDPASIIAQALKKKFAHRRRQEANSPGIQCTKIITKSMYSVARCRINIHREPVGGSVQGRRHKELPYAHPSNLRS